MRWKKLIAPIIITAVLVLWFFTYLVLCFVTDMPAVFAAVVALVSLVLAGVSVFVLVERIKEVRSGEEDDLSQY